MAPDPAYPSQDNPIEHRLCPPLPRACQGVIFTRVNVVQELMEQATTNTGLRVRVHLLDNVSRLVATSLPRSKNGGESLG